MSVLKKSINVWSLLKNERKHAFDVTLSDNSDDVFSSKIVRGQFSNYEGSFYGCSDCINYLRDFHTCTCSTIKEHMDNFSVNKLLLSDIYNVKYKVNNKYYCDKCIMKRKKWIRCSRCYHKMKRPNKIMYYNQKQEKIFCSEDCKIGGFRANTPPCPSDESDYEIWVKDV